MLFDEGYEKALAYELGFAAGFRHSYSNPYSLFSWLGEHRGRNNEGAAYERGFQDGLDAWLAA